MDPLKKGCVAVSLILCAFIIAASAPAAASWALDLDLPKAAEDGQGNGEKPEGLEVAGEGIDGGRQPGIRLFLDDVEISLSDPIKRISNRTYLPLRSFCEVLGAEVTWRQDLNTVGVVRGRVDASFGINTSLYTVNGLFRHMADATLYLDESINRTYIPIRYGAETLGFAVDWVMEEGLESVYILSTPVSMGGLSDNEISVGGKLVWLGQTERQLIGSLGYPNRIDESAYGLQWFVYNRSYRNFIMVGVTNQRVSGFFCNGATMEMKGGLGYGAGKGEAEATGLSRDTMALWFDPHDGDRLYAAFCMADIPAAADQQATFNKNQDRLLRAYEMECLDITNAFRAANGIPEVLYSAHAAKVALSYAEYMAEYNYLEHITPDGLNQLDRFEAQGIYPLKVLENLAGGYANAIHVFKGWVESESHRKGMLADFQYLGVGAFYKSTGRYRYFFVQEFINMK